MSAPPVAIVGAGMMTGVGLTAPASCAAIRCLIDNFSETRFVGSGGEWIMGSAVPLDRPWRGQTKLVKMVAGPVRECMALVPDVPTREVPLFLCVAETDRPGANGIVTNSLYEQLQSEVGVEFSAETEIISQGRIGPALALGRAREMLYRGHLPPPFAIIAAVDSFLTGPTLAAYQQKGRILAEDNSNGFIPGEAGGAIVVSRHDPRRSDEFVCLGLGFARELATVESEEPLRGDGLTQAASAALNEAGLSMGDMDYRITDVNGEEYAFKEADLVVSRLLRERKENFGIWHPTECIGEVGVAALPCMLAVALDASRKRYALGPTAFCHVGNDDGRRGALVLRSGGGRPS